MFNSSYSVDKLKKELLKCTVLCANCHRKFHVKNKSTGITLEEYIKDYKNNFNIHWEFIAKGIKTILSYQTQQVLGD